MYDSSYRCLPWSFDMVVTSGEESEQRDSKDALYGAEVWWISKCRQVVSVGKEVCCEFLQMIIQFSDIMVVIEERTQIRQRKGSMSKKSLGYQRNREIQHGTKNRDSKSLIDWFCLSSDPIHSPPQPGIPIRALLLKLFCPSFNS